MVPALVGAALGGAAAATLAGTARPRTSDGGPCARPTGKICLPVQSADGQKTSWQQGPVPFGTTHPSPNAPATPLPLGTDNKPVGPGGDRLPRTGAGGDVLPLGAAGAALIAAGAAGVWWSRRRVNRQTPSHSTHPPTHVKRARGAFSASDRKSVV